MAVTPCANPPQLLPSEGPALTPGKPGPGGDQARKADRPEASLALVEGGVMVGGLDGAHRYLHLSQFRCHLLLLSAYCLPRPTCHLIYTQDLPDPQTAQ